VELRKSRGTDEVVRLLELTGGHIRGGGGGGVAAAAAAAAAVVVVVVDD
jgi:hypothetical protein